jgi:hypothetical protein
MKKIIMIIFFGMGFILFVACPSISEKQEHDVVKTIQTKEPDSLSYNVSSENYLSETKRVKAIIDGIEMSFYTQARVHHISSFPCNNCHSESLESLQQPGIKKAHWNISLNHAGQDVMNCQTCHSSSNLNELTSLTGNIISFDHSYQLCRQCHSQQHDDWIGGAHGKRLGGWAPPRVINNCVNCHNPHEPAFGKRFPSRLNTTNLE